MKAIISAISALLISGFPASAESFKSMNRLDVNPLTATEFEVVQAADLARKRFGALRPTIRSAHWASLQKPTSPLIRQADLA